MKRAYDVKFKKAAQDQLNKHVEDMINEHPGKAYSALKKNIEIFCKLQPRVQTIKIVEADSDSTRQTKPIYQPK